jgi:hypothetical protein
MEPEWMETAGAHRVTPLVGATDWAQLAEAIEQAIAVPA